MHDTPAAPLKAKDRAYLALLQLLSRLPLPFLRRFGALLGRLAALPRQSRAVRTVARNLELCYPGQTAAWRAAVLRANFVHTGMLTMEFAKIWGMPPDWTLGRITRVHNEQLFHDAIAVGRGTIAIVPHFGTWEVMNPWLSQHVAPVIMYKPGKDAGVNAFVLAARSRLRTTLVPTDESGVRAVFKALRKNGFTAILPDHLPDASGGLHAPFFGINALTGTLVPKLVERTGCRVIVMHCLRTPEGFEMYFSEPDAGIYDADTAIATAALNRTVEQVIAVDPAQYQWSYKRFRRSSDIDDPYLSPEKAARAAARRQARQARQTEG